MLHRRSTLLPLLVGSILGASMGTTHAATGPTCTPSPASIVHDVPYVVAPVSPDQTLDITAPTNPDGCAPVVIWVHGGAWAFGDKSKVWHLAQLADRLGAVFVAVDYRLSFPVTDPARAVHPAHAIDVGAAVAWVEHNIAAFGGDPRRLLLLGESAGGHLASLVALDPRYVVASGGDPAAIRCVVANDAEGYDIPARRRLRADIRSVLDNAFGTDPAIQRDASPIFHVADREDVPEFLIVTRGPDRRVAAARRFAAAVEAAGAGVEVVDARPYTHLEAYQRLGQRGETVVTPPVESFVQDCLVDAPAS